MGKVHCVVHTSKVYVGYCQDCEKHVCVECMMVQHKGHVSIQLDKIAEIKTAELLNFVSKFKEINMMNLEENVQVLQDKQQKYKDLINVLISEITERAEWLKTEIDHFRDELIRELQQTEKEDLKQLKQFENKMTEEIAELKKFIQTIEEQKFPTGTDVIQHVIEIKQQLSKYNIPSTRPGNLPLPSFVTMYMQQKDLRKLFGHLSTDENKHGGTNTDIGKLNQDQSVHILSSFLTRQDPSRIAAVSDDEIWISDSNFNGDLTLVKQDGHVIKSYSTKFIINDLAVTSSGELLLTDGYNSKIVCMKKTGQFVDYISTVPDTPCGLCISQDSGDIFVTLRQNVGSVGKIIRLSANKQIKQTIKHNSAERDLFTLPHFITQNKNKDLWIQDKGYHHVVVIDQTGKPKFIYKGPTGVKMGSAFDPHDLTSTENGEVIIADNNNATLHLVDMNGQFLRYIMTSQDGLSGPYALARSVNNSLWISDNKLNKVFLVKCLC